MPVARNSVIVQNPEFERISAMNATDLAKSASSDESPPSGLSAPAEAMWLAKAGRWEEAHEFCQKIPGNAGAWIHAYLHREEGDPSNAAYWYGRAEKPVPDSSISLEEEWIQIAAALI